jgi:hypothetical protein
VEALLELAYLNIVKQLEEVSKAQSAAKQLKSLTSEE